MVNAKNAAIMLQGSSILIDMSSKSSKNNSPGGGNKDLSNYVSALSHSAVQKILLDLCNNDKSLTKRVIMMAKADLSDVDSDEVSDEVYARLNAIQIEDWWDNSGKTRYGYNEPTDVAFEMVEDAVDVFVSEMEKYKTLGMKKAEVEYCKGIISGLLRYGNEGNNEFHDAVPDDPYTIADNLLYDWEKYHSAEDFAEIKAVYDSCFEYEDDD